ncbi:MAG: sigma 54-interacting transcriptional regulator [Deltaproteobacteria bacterium]|nr:sigma 54-interacting transcriptional regulator [Deltaproteobacteria bacterium]
MLEQDMNTYWRTVVDTIQDAVMIVDTDGTIVTVNAAFAQVTGYGAEEIVGRSCAVLQCPSCHKDREGNKEHWCSLFRTGAVRRHRCTIRHRSGKDVPVIKNAAVLRDRAGGVLGGVETLTDISALVDRERQIEAFRRELSAQDGFEGLIGISRAMQGVFDLIANAAQSDAPVIIFGESGTGKELVARAIHQRGPRREKPYVKVNCAALAESLLESELFGHVRGAFTGAVQARQGRFEAAAGGDIFLDEIGDLPMTSQVKLLRVLEEKVIERVGDNRPIPVDVRIITATNRDLGRMVTEGRFREDLFYRINVIPLILPPLRERMEDIPLLAESFFRRLQLKSEKPVETIAYDTMGMLMAYDWPGNVRELRSAFEYAFVACPGGAIEPKHLPPNILRHCTCLPASAADAKSPEDVPPPRSIGGLSPRDILIAALEQAGGNQSAAARILGVSRGTVWNRMRRYGIKARSPWRSP